MRKLLLLLASLLLSASAFASSVALSWTASTTSGAQYNVYRGTATGGPYTLQNTTPLATTVTTYTDSTVASGNTYFYVVRSVINSIESVNSNEFKAVIAPAPPTGLNGTVTISMAAPQTNSNGTLAMNVDHSPANPFNFTVSAMNPNHRITGFQAYLDGSSTPLYSYNPTADFAVGYEAALQSLASGSHTIHHTAWDDTGASVGIDTTVTVP